MISEFDRGVRAALLAHHKTFVDQRPGEAIDDYYQRVTTEKIDAMNSLLDRDNK